MPIPVTLLVAIIFALGEELITVAEASLVILPLAISSAVLSKVNIDGQIEIVTKAAVRVALVQLLIVQLA